MNRYLKIYIEDGYFLRIKNLVMTDFYIDNKKSLHLALEHLDAYDHESSFFENFDFKTHAFVLKINNDSLDQQHYIVKAFEQYQSEFSHPTILFNKKSFFEIIENNGEYDEGWTSSFSEFNYESFEIYTDYGSSNFPYIKNNLHFHKCRDLLISLKEKSIDLTSDKMLLRLNFERLIKLLSLCVEESVLQTATFLNGYYLERPDIESMRIRHGEEFEDYLAICRTIILELKKINPEI